MAETIYEMLNIKAGLFRSAMEYSHWDKAIAILWGAYVLVREDIKTDAMLFDIFSAFITNARELYEAAQRNIANVEQRVRLLSKIQQCENALKDTKFYYGK